MTRSCSSRHDDQHRGEKYENVAGKWMGYFDTFKTCERCHDLRQWLVNSLPCFCWGYGGAFEEAAEQVDEACWRAPDETKGLRFGFWRQLHAYEKARH